MSRLALVAVQLALGPDELTSERAFASAIERAARDAARASAGAPHRLLVFPENTGHFLPLVHAPAIARRQPTVQRAMAALALCRPLSVLRAALAARSLDLDRAVMRALLPAADTLMRDVFARVARQHQAFVVAGSHLRVSAGAITNSSYTFDPEGRLVAVTDKANLVPGLEDDAPGGLGLARGDAHGLPVVQAPWGRLATLICYDGFWKPHTRNEPFAFMGARADALGVHVIANPSANPWSWRGAWVHAEPGSSLARCEQWHDEGLPGTLRRLTHTSYGITAQLSAAVFEHRFEGRSQILARRGSEVEVLAEARREDRADVVVAEIPVPSVPS